MSKMSFENHIMKQFDEELEEIRTRLMAMGGKVEQQLQNAIRAVTEADSALAESVIKEEKLLEGIGRVRSLEIGPKGYVYAGVENLGIIKILPN